MSKIRLASVNSVRKHGWAILAAVAAIVMARCLRAHQLGESDAVSAAAVGLLLLVAAFLVELLRLRRA